MTKFADAIVAHFRPLPPEKRPCGSCGKMAVLWPYGKDGEDICIPCAAEDLESTCYAASTRVLAGLHLPPNLIMGEITAMAAEKGISPKEYVIWVSENGAWS